MASKAMKLLKNAAVKMAGKKKKLAKSPGMQDLEDVFAASSTPRRVGGMNSAPRAQVPDRSTNLNSRPLNMLPARRDAKKPKKAKKGKKYAHKGHVHKSSKAMKAC